MTPREIRRAAERQALKAARKANHNQPSPTQSTPHGADNPIPNLEQDAGCQPAPVSSSLSEAQLAANRANSQHSTGPTSTQGKATVSQNRITHGLAGTFRLLGWEDPAQFQELAKNLYKEHQPLTDSECRLVDSMAQHFWLMQRALTLQDRLLVEPQLDHKSFSLYLRYQTTNERAYYRAKRELSQIRTEKRKLQNGFESQKRQQELAEARIRLTNAKASATEIETEVKSTMEAPLPGHVSVPFEDLKYAFRSVMQDLNRQFEEKLNQKAAA